MRLPKLTEEEFVERYTNAPDEIRDALDSEEARKSILDLCRAHYLNPQKATLFEQLVGFVLLGYIAPRDLAREIGEHLYLNHEHSRVLANEVGTRILEPILEELEGFYNPIEESEETNEGGLKINAETVDDSAEKPVSVALKEGAPLVLHEESSFFQKERPKSNKSFFPFFATSPESSETLPSVRVKVETPPEKKVIHYSESRSLLSPLESSPEQFISIEALEKMRSTPPEIELPRAIESQPSSLKPLENTSSPSPVVITKDITQEAVPTPATPEKKGFSWPLKLFGEKKKENIEQKMPTTIPPTSQPIIIPPSPETAVKSQPTAASSTTFDISLDISSLGHKQPEIEGNVVHLK
ncbi:MAG: hypothetical protein WCW78_01335 [Candidatus Paceibacterota bacterium]|jgi:hypothetical protein